MDSENGDWVEEGSDRYLSIFLRDEVRRLTTMSKEHAIDGGVLVTPFYDNACCAKAASKGAYLIPEEQLDYVLANPDSAKTMASELSAPRALARGINAFPIAK